MTDHNFPKKGEKLFLMHKEVIVIKVYSIFNLIKLRYKGDIFEFFVDACALTNMPDFSKSISIGKFKREYNE